MWILIFVIATSTSAQSGAAAGTPEFTSYDKCVKAGKLLSKNTTDRGNYVIALTCVEK